MILSEGLPDSEEPRAEEGENEPKRTTLPPPEWKVPAVDGPRNASVAPNPLPRRVGVRAEEAWLRARVEDARAAGDDAALSVGCAQLAQWLASHDRDLDEAVEFATTALAIEESAELRRELAAWLESLGEASRAAGLLKPIASMANIEATEAAYVLMRTGVLKARAGGAAAAAAAFEAAMSIDVHDPLPGELLGAVSTWQPDGVSASVAARAYVDSARRRAGMGQGDAQLEDLWRALATDALDEEILSALSEALEQRGRTASADEVWRAHARRVADFDGPRALRAHARRRAAALAAQQSVRALGAALDEGLDAELEGERGAVLDALLFDVGMLEVVAARLEARAARATEASARAAHLVELGRLCAGALAARDRAAAVYAAALAADPGSEEALLALAAMVGDLREEPRVAPVEARIEPLRAIAASLGDIADERERYERMVQRLGRGFPGMAAARTPVDDDSGSRAAAATAWVSASLAGDARAQAAALLRVAAAEAVPLRAVLLSLAAERQQASGDAGAARQTAERATQADPASARCIATLAGVVLRERDRPAAVALERAIAIVGPRAEWCFALADALDALGEVELAVGWTLRCVALRPGHRMTIETLLDRLVRARDPGRLGDALAWLLSQPQPVSWLGDPFAAAVEELARLDPERGAVVARRALDVFGPKCAPLRSAMLSVASRASDTAFAAAVLERWLSCGIDEADRRDVFVRLADLRQALGDEEGEARVVGRAVREGVSSSEIDAHLDRLADGALKLTPDAQLWCMRARSERLAVGGQPEAASWAWRDYGAALWDLADDRVGAIAAWQRAARLAGSRGYVTFALDLVTFADPLFAFEYLARLVDGEPDDAAAAAIAAGAARAAHVIDEPRVAFNLAARGIARHPWSADALDIAERAADGAGEDAALSGLYDLVAVRALGRFGRRAAHYRGARFFERRGDHALALKHAAQAFYAVPSQGSSFQLLTRAAERAGDHGEAVRMVEQVAELAAQPEVRAGWLLLAASIAGAGLEGARSKLDALVRATAAAPTIPAITSLRVAAQELLGYGPEERDVVEMRLDRVRRTVSASLHGPRGARAALAFATMALDLLGDSDGAMASVERAFDCDPDVDEYNELVTRAEGLGRAKRARGWVETTVVAAEGSHAGVGLPALRALTAIAAAMGDEPTRERAVIAMATREPDDDDAIIAADAVARNRPDLAALLARRVPAARRADALLAAARARVGEGAHGDAASLLERAVDLLDGTARADVERELRRVWETAGRGAEIEARVHLEAASDVASASMRADRWMEIAERREARGDKPGTVRAVIEACKLDPGPLERWSALERVAEMAEDDGARVSALEEIAKRVDGDGRVAVFKRLARAHERRSDLASAEEVWLRVLDLDPEDEEADQVIESVVVARGRYEQLADHLARRAERLSAKPGTQETLRALRLRRAAILEQRLGRVQDACEELGLLLAEWPDNPGALRYLADLLERQGQHARAAPLWRHAATIETDPSERDALELKAGRASCAAGELPVALEHANRVLARNPSCHEALELRVEIARALGADVELGDALEAMAASEGVDWNSSCDFLVEAAQAAARSGDPNRALDRARGAATAAPERAAPQLLARGLEYRLRGAGAPDEARRTIDDLARIREPLGPDDAALRAFLLAEALDVVQGGGAGLAELEAAREAIGEHALVALGLAERWAAQGQPAAAVDAYRMALAGPLLGLRRPGMVAVAAADEATRANRPDDVAYFLEIAERHEDVRASAKLRRVRLAGGVAETLRPPSIRPGADTTLEDLEASVRSAPTPEERSRARMALGRARLDRGDARAAEPLLWEALADGLAAAGDLLAPVLTSSDRQRDLVRLRRQQVAIEPGDAGRLELLHAAALADDDRVYASAVEHVLRAFDSDAGPLPPPALASQAEQPGVFALLARPSMDAAGEALALLWEGAMQLFVRDAASYGITGVARVVPGPTTAITRACEVAMRVLDAPRIPLFVPRSVAGPPLAHVALLSPPAVVLTGDVREDTAELRFALGCGMSAALAQNVLRLGLPPVEGRALVEALYAGFGPPEIGRRVSPRAARLAESFWQIVPARTQRRLQELLGIGPLPDHEDLVARARQSGRRVGMFLAGDFACAARALLAEPAAGGRPLRDTVRADGMPSPATLRSFCEQLPVLADLLRLAVSPEYADARWHPMPPSSPRGTMPSGRFSLL